MKAKKILIIGRGSTGMKLVNSFFSKGLSQGVLVGA